MKNLIRKISVLTIILLVVSCTTTKETSKSEKEEETINKKEIIREIDLTVEDANCWINLMPGAGSKFHISGKFTVPNVDENEKIDLKRVLVYQKNKMIYIVVPKVRKSKGVSSVDLTYSTIKGLTLFPELNVKVPVDLVLEVKKDGELFKYTIENVKIEEAH